MDDDYIEVDRCFNVYDKLQIHKIRQEFYQIQSQKEDLKR